jgi:hypothetical protein
MPRFVSLLVISVVTAFNVGAHAANSFSFVDSFSAAPSVTNSRTDRDICANFAGNWKGTCSATGGTTSSESFTITQQGCAMMKVTADEGKKVAFLPVGGVFSMGGAIAGSPAVSFGMNFTSSWDKDQKVLSVFMTAGGKKLAIDEAGGGVALMEKISMPQEKKLSVEVYSHGSAGNKIALCNFDLQ